MKMLILVADYPNNDGGRALQYVHTRNIFYQQSDNDVTVLNFSAKENYIIDNVKVITKDYYKKFGSNDNYDLLVCHAANIRNHYLFLKKYHKRFNNIVFFFHGHEVLNVTKVYSKPYSFVKQGKIKTMLRQIYDNFKLRLWKIYYEKLSYKSYFVFVSNWMYTEFCKWVKMDTKKLENRYSITYNSIGKSFETISYDLDSPKTYDFITIRGSLDGSKYCIDFVNKMAEDNPQYSFCIIGKGTIFQHFTKSKNVVWINDTLSHDDIIKYLNKSRYALMPTRTDAQGLMACEMASFGIPLITSDIPVCHEIFDDFKNVKFITNDASIDLTKVIENFTAQTNYKNDKYYQKNTCEEELEIFKKVVGCK